MGLGGRQGFVGHGTVFVPHRGLGWRGARLTVTAEVRRPLPTFGDLDARTLGELAAEAEATGWDGFFCWDHVLYDPLGRGWPTPRWR